MLNEFELARRIEILRARGVPQKFVEEIASRNRPSEYSELASMALPILVLFVFSYLLSFDALIIKVVCGGVLRADIFGSSIMTQISKVVTPLLLFFISIKYIFELSRRQRIPKNYEKYRRGFLDAVASKLYTINPGQKVSKRLFRPKLAAITECENSEEYLSKIKMPPRALKEQQISLIPLGIALFAFAFSLCIPFFDFWRIDGHMINYRFFTHHFDDDLKNAKSATIECEYVNPKYGSDYAVLWYSLDINGAKIQLNTPPINDKEKDGRYFSQIDKIDDYLRTNGVSIYFKKPKEWQSGTQSCLNLLFNDKTPQNRAVLTRILSKSFQTSN